MTPGRSLAATDRTGHCVPVAPIAWAMGAGQVGYTPGAGRRSAAVGKGNATRSRRGARYWLWMGRSASDHGPTSLAACAVSRLTEGTPTGARKRATRAERIGTAVGTARPTIATMDHPLPADPPPVVRPNW